MTKRDWADSHRIAVLKLENGELTEDVVRQELIDADEPPRSGIEASPGESDDVNPRIVDSYPVPKSTDRPHPAAPLPGTLPRDQVDDAQSTRGS